jgi:hypothetical protein
MDFKGLFLYISHRPIKYWVSETQADSKMGVDRFV